MIKRLLPVLLPAFLLAPLSAQEGFDMQPAEQLQQLASLVGNWDGGGKMLEPGNVETKWKARGTFRWCLGGHFLQEDFRFDFAGQKEPLIMHGYVGWDRENNRFVRIVVHNEGVAAFEPMDVQPDGSVIKFGVRRLPGFTYSERSTIKADGDKLTMASDLLMATGGAFHVFEGEFKRSKKAYEANWKAGGWNGAKPSDEMQKLTRMAGVYQTNGEMVMAPGMPTMKITGTDTFRSVFGGMLLMAKTEGKAEGSPLDYESHAFWAWDATNRRVLSVFVDNMGQLGEMHGYWVGDDFVNISAVRQQGVPTTQRFVIKVDGKGKITEGVGHTCSGAMDPFVSFRATYKQK